MDSLKVTNEASRAVASGPRVDLDDIEAAIMHKWEFTAKPAFEAMNMPVSEESGLLSICILQMRNGFLVIGKSAPASAENFNAELGRRLAYEDCIRQLWPLAGYSLRDKLAGY